MNDGYSSILSARRQALQESIDRDKRLGDEYELDHLRKENQRLLKENQVLKDQLRAAGLMPNTVEE